MGNTHRYSPKQLEPQTNSTHSLKKNKFVPVDQFEFLKPFEEDTTNGLCLNGIYLPEKTLQNILSHIPPKNLLKLTLVCKKWCDIIKSEIVWMEIYNRQCPNKKAKKLPWYIYYCYFTTKNFDNILRNGNGQEKFRHWKIVKNLGNGFKIEDPPRNSDHLSPNVPEFNGFTSCFVTSSKCNKIQEISLRNKRLLRYILNKFKPNIYVSEWVVGRFDCDCTYRMSLRGYDEEYTEDMVLNSEVASVSKSSPVPLFHKKTLLYRICHWAEETWQKCEILIDEYPPNVTMLIFEHEGQSISFRKGYKGSKMAGGVVRIVFDSIQFPPKYEFAPVDQFEFLKPFEEDTANGLCLNDIYLPKEVLQNILSRIPPEDLLGLTLVCKKWCNIIKADSFWMNLYNSQYTNKKAKKLPWYVFYCYFTTRNFDNLLKNGNGQENFRHWKIVKNLGKGFLIEDPPRDSDPLPPDVPEFNGFASCFVTNFYNECNKVQEISLRNKRLLRYILNKFKPHIYVSEWVAGRYDCSCLYKMSLLGYGEDFCELTVFKNVINGLMVPSLVPLFHKRSPPYSVQRWQVKRWEKIEILVEEYPPNISVLVFEHEGRDAQFESDGYQSKMAGGVVRIEFDSIQPLDDENETK